MARDVKLPMIRNSGEPRDSRRSIPRKSNRFLDVRIAIAGVMACVVLAACGSPSDVAGTTTRSVQSATLAAGQPIPAPTGEVDLQLSGATGVTNEGDELLLDVETIERMPLVAATLFEPFLKKQVRFEGVLLSDLLRYADVSEAGFVEMTALDDYHVSFDLNELDADRVLLAVRADGQRISIADGGPTRIVFLDADDGLGANTDNWIWSVSHMVFEGIR